MFFLTVDQFYTTIGIFIVSMGSFLVFLIPYLGWVAARLEAPLTCPTTWMMANLIRFITYFLALITAGSFTVIFAESILSILYFGFNFGNVWLSTLIGLAAIYWLSLIGLASHNAHIKSVSRIESNE